MTDPWGKGWRAQLIATHQGQQGCAGKGEESVSVGGGSCVSHNMVNWGERRTETVVAREGQDGRSSVWSTQDFGLANSVT